MSYLLAVKAEWGGKAGCFVKNWTRAFTGNFRLSHEASFSSKARNVPSGQSAFCCVQDARVLHLHARVRSYFAGMKKRMPMVCPEARFLMRFLNLTNVDAGVVEIALQRFWSGQTATKYFEMAAGSSRQVCSQILGLATEHFENSRFKVD